MPTLQMFTTTMTQPDPALFMRQFLSRRSRHQGEQIAGPQHYRWQNPEYDKLFHDAEIELDPVKRAALFIAMNDLVIKNVVVIPVVYRTEVGAVSNKLHAAGERLGQQRLGLAGLVSRCLTSDAR